ncbi:hypothetical protein F0U61_09745 [Archangium violaceum]|uniref:hypothetical protein n=1 Tax=Archangium violaceum TaxID=83451 RepID=UPI002B2D7566|nr:hypothetical protein F0U61_09745 [Archangium violaceum]
MPAEVSRGEAFRTAAHPDTRVLDWRRIHHRSGVIISHFTFNIPLTVRVEQAQVLALMVHAVAGTINNLHAEILLNNTQVFTYGPTNRSFTAPFHKVVPGNILKAGSNTMAVRVVNGQGTFRASDILLWFQNDV